MPRPTAPRAVARVADGASSRIRSFERSLPMALLRAREAVMRQFRPSLRRHGVTEQQWRVLRALTAVERIEVLALARTTCLLPPSLSRILKALEERGLVLRQPAPNDLRSSLISISAKGMKLIERAAADSEAIYAEITRRFGADRMATLYEFLGKLESELGDLTFCDFEQAGGASLTLDHLPTMSREVIAMPRRRSIYIDSFKHSNPLPNACRIGNLVMSSVIVGCDPGARTVSPSLEQQCTNMFAHVKATIEAAGGTADDIIKMTFWMKDRSQRDVLNVAWAKMFPDPENRPARHSIQTELDGGVLIQCDFTAVIGA